MIIYDSLNELTVHA